MVHFTHLLLEGLVFKLVFECSIFWSFDFSSGFKCTWFSFESTCLSIKSLICNSFCLHFRTSEYLLKILFFFLSFVIVGSHPGHMEVLKLRVESELYCQPILQLQQCQIQDMYDLYHSSQQHRVLNPTEQDQGSNPPPHVFLTVEPQWELLFSEFLQLHKANLNHSSAITYLLVSELGFQYRGR